MTIVHVSVRAISGNTTGQPVPAIEIARNSDPPELACEVEIRGPCRIVYRPQTPLSTGARVWIETDAEVVAIGSTVPVPPVP